MQVFNGFIGYFPKWSVFGYAVFFAAVMLATVISLTYAKKHNISKLRAVVWVILPAFCLFVYSSAVITRPVYENPEHHFRLFWSYDKPWKYWGFSIRKEILMNILAFVPIGMTLPVSLGKKGLWRTVLTGFSFSFIIEISQYIFSKGSYETDDLFHNTLGALVGYLFFMLVSCIFEERGKTRETVLLPSQKTLLSLVSASLFGGDFKIYENTDLAQTVKEAISHTVSVLAFSASGTDILPENVRSYLQKYNRSIIMKSANVSYAHVSAHEIFSSNNVPYVIIKGNASAHYYPEPQFRSMGDVDILVRENDFEKACTLLCSQGFETGFQGEKHTSFYKKTAGYAPCIELHRKIGGIPDGESGEIIEEYLSDIIETAVCVKTNDGEFYMPDDFHHGLVLLLHTALHLTSSGVGLRHICDWAVFAEKFEDDIFREIFEEKLKNAGLWRFAAVLTALCEEYLGLPHKEWSEKAATKEELEKLITDVFLSGNFGQKNRERLNQAKLFRDGKKGNISTANMLSQLFSSLGEKAKADFPGCREHKLLLPFAVSAVAFNHIKKIKKGARPRIHIGGMVQGASERKELYKIFHLFENE